MAMTDIQLCNMALGHVGVAQTIANLETERSNEADRCTLYLAQAKESTLEDFAWPEATAYATLGLVTDNSQVSTPYDWLYAYRYPSDCVHVRRIVTVLGRGDPNPPPFHIGSDSSGKLVWTNQATAVIEYTKRLDDVNLFSMLLAEAVSWRLASFIAPSLSRIKGMAGSALQMYGLVLARAQVKAGNEQQQSPEPESEFTRARE